METTQYHLSRLGRCDGRTMGRQHMTTVYRCPSCNGATLCRTFFRSSERYNSDRERWVSTVTPDTHYECLGCEYQSTDEEEWIVEPEVWAAYQAICNGETPTVSAKQRPYLRAFLEQTHWDVFKPSILRSHAFKVRHRKILVLHQYTAGDRHGYTSAVNSEEPTRESL